MSATKKRICACPRGCRVRVYGTLTCDYCTYACAVNEDGALNEDPQTYSGYVAISSTEGTRVMAVEAMGACECLCCRDDADAGGGADDDHADAGGGAAPRRRAQDYAAGLFFPIKVFKCNSALVMQVLAESGPIARFI